MNFVYVSDFLYPASLGGAEQNDAELINVLQLRGHTVAKCKSDEITDKFVLENKDKKFIISNFVFMFSRIRDLIQDNCDYILYTHDHQYLITRDPSPYRETDFKAPESDLRHVAFYKNATGIICQSAMHAEIVYRNLGLEQIYNVGGNLWTEDVLNLLTSLSEKPKKECSSIMLSNISHKNTEGAVQYCRKMDQKYELLAPKVHKEFLEDMSNNSSFVFFPQTIETLSRIVCEARMMNCAVKTNNNIGAASEPWFGLKGKELIDVMRQKREDIPALVEDIFGY